MRWMWLATVVMVACGSDDTGDAPRVCYFESGRPCPVGVACFGGQGNECNYYGCNADGAIEGTAIACMPGFGDPTGRFDHDCDPASIHLARPGAPLPPPSPCPLGSMATIVDGLWARCVPARECHPLPCDAAYGDDGCPTSFHCNPTTSTCVPPV